MRTRPPGTSPAMTLLTIVIIVAVLVVIAVVVTAVFGLNKRHRTQRHHEAVTLREEAVSGTPAIQESELHAQEAEARAERSRLQAERAEHEAAAARQGVDVEQAEYEDRIREADRVDPAVDHKAPDYTPDTTPAEQATQTGPEAGGRHTV
jgi:FtsZ-interacting cell division protein ZipA